MKRMIVCKNDIKKQIPHYEGEWFKQVKGTAKRDYICDLCGTAILTGDECAAQSMGVHWTPYSTWESEFIEIYKEVGKQ